MKLVFGCLLCKKNLPHNHHNELPPFSTTRAYALIEDIRKIFFKDYRGKWYTKTEIDEEGKKFYCR